MKYLFNNLEVIQATIAQEQKGKLSSKNRLDQQQQDYLEY